MINTPLQANSMISKDDTFAQLLAAIPPSKQAHTQLKASSIDTPLGQMIAIASQTELYLLEFVDGRSLTRELTQLSKSHAINLGLTPPITSIQSELKAYFSGKLKTFTTPLCFLGSPFQQRTWKALTTIPYGQTKSYAEQARHIGQPKAYRAVANANGANQLAIIIPCHRIITSSGKLGGYDGGIARKKFLLDLEEKYSKTANV